MVIELADGTEQRLELSKATAVRTSKQMVHLDQLDDGTWRLIWSAGTIPDFSAVKMLRVERG